MRANQRRARIVLTAAAVNHGSGPSGEWYDIACPGGPKACATGFGGVLGAGAQLALGWPWCLVAAAVAAAVGLFFLSTAFWGRAGSTRSLATEVLMVLDPARAIRHDRRRVVEGFLAAPFPLYGLPPSWSGPRHLGGWQRRGGRGGPVITALSLAHGDPLAGQGLQLRVEAGVGPGPSGGIPTTPSELRRDLADELWLDATAWASRRRALGSICRRSSRGPAAGPSTP